MTLPLAEARALADDAQARALALGKALLTPAFRERRPGSAPHNVVAAISTRTCAEGNPEPCGYRRLVVDFVLHGDGGRASAWTAKPSNWPSTRSRS